MAKPLPSPEDAQCPVHSCLSHTQWSLCKRNGWTWKQVLQAGIGVLTANGDFAERIRCLESEVGALRKQRQARDKVISDLEQRRRGR